MAMIKKDVSTMAMPLSMQRTEPAPIDAYSIWYSLAEAQAYAAGTGANKAAYVGQVITVVDEANSKATAYVIADTNGTLQEVGAGSAQPMLFVDNEEQMLGLTEIEAGQQVYRADTHTVWIFKGGDASQASQWVESASASDTIWYGTQNKVIFYALTKDAYDALDSKDTNTLYFLTDAGKIFKGADDLTESVVKVESFPEAAKAIPGVLYVGPAAGETTPGGELRVSNGTAWTVVRPGYYTDGASWANAESGQFATIGLIKRGIQEAINALSFTTVFDTEAGTIKVGDGSADTLTGVAHGITYDASALKITIPQYGQDDVVVNIPKDKFVTAGKYYEDYPEENPTLHKVIVLTIDNQEDPVIIPAEALVNIYTADNTNKNVQITISDDNKISGMIALDPDANNALKYDAAKGFIVNVSGKMDKIADATGDKIVLSTADGQVKESTKGIDSFAEKVVGAVDNLMSFGANGAIKDSGKKVGGATLAATTDSDTLATEKAVEAALSWVELT